MKFYLSFTYRILLLALLPSAGLIIYLKGQNYDPAIINFEPALKSNGSGSLQKMDAGIQNPSISSDFFPDKISGLDRTGRIKHFTKDNLYEYVNGHAEYFISAGFAGLLVGEYASSGTDASRPDIQTEIYDMGRSIQAFGILMDERGGDNTAEVKIGVMGLKTSDGISFFKGRYYVKIRSFNPKINIMDFAKGIDAKLEVKPDQLPVLSGFHDVGKVVSTRFIKEGYRGLDFFNNVIEREYLYKGKTVQVAIVYENTDVINTLAAKFMDYFKRSDIKYEKIGAGEKTIIYRVMDHYEGEWFLITADNAIYGIYGTTDKKILDHFR